MHVDGYTIPNYLIHKLQKILNSAARFIFGLYGQRRSRYHISPYLKYLHFLPVFYRIKYKTAILTYNCIHGFAPKYLCELIDLRNNDSEYYLRSYDDNLLLKRKYTHYVKCESAFSVAAPKIWNELPYSLRSCNNVNNFKSNLKTYYFNIAFSDTPDIIP